MDLVYENMVREVIRCVNITGRSREGNGRPVAKASKSGQDITNYKLLLLKVILIHTFNRYLFSSLKDTLS